MPRARAAAAEIGRVGVDDQGGTKGALIGWRNDVNAFDTQSYPNPSWHWIVSWLKLGRSDAAQAELFAAGEVTLFT